MRRIGHGEPVAVCPVGPGCQDRIRNAEDTGCATFSCEHDARPRRASAGYLVTEKVEQFKPWTEPFIKFACGGGALRPTIS
jgi:hypothetical protein